jgi:sec-independent protein translocase protein TatB
MFDITSSKLLLLGIVALLVIGPKDLPALLRTVGKYMGIVKRHAAEFRAQFDEAIRESELDQIKKDVERLGSDAEAAVRDAGQSVEKDIASARQDVDAMMGDAKTPAELLALETQSLPQAHGTSGNASTVAGTASEVDGAASAAAGSNASGSDARISEDKTSEVKTGA